MIKVKRKELLLLMAHKGCNGTDLAKSVGMPQPNMSQIICGKSIRAETALKICKALECNFDDVFVVE